MRVVVFTGNPQLDSTPWWRILVATRGIDAILICRKITSSHPRDVAQRFRRNVRKHGLLFIPYRVGLLAIQLIQRPFRRAQPAPEAVAAPPTEEVEALDLHAAEVLERVRAFGADLGVSLGAPILRKSLFGLPRRGTINLHLGKVPDFRGAPPAFWEMVTGATTVGATIHWMDEQLDTGPVIASGEAPIYSHDRLADVEARAAELGSRLLRQSLDYLAVGEAPSRPQSREGGSTNRQPTLGQRTALDWTLWGRRVRARLAPRQLAKSAILLGATWFYRPARDLLRTLRRQHPVRIFTFHRVTTLCRDGMTVAPDVFRRQVAHISAHHNVVTLETGVDLIRSGARLRRPAAVLTFDDGYRSVFEAARPIMAEFRVPGCCFVSTDLVGTDRRFAHDEGHAVRAFFDVMDWAQLASLHAEGWSVGTHTANHARLSSCTGEQLGYEIEQPRRALREQLGVTEPVLAYPFGQPADISDEALTVARRAGHTAVLHDFGGENMPGSSALVLARIEIGGDHETLAWKAQCHGINVARWRELWRPLPEPPTRTVAVSQQ